MTQGMTPEYRSLRLYADFCQWVMLARDAAIDGDDRAMRKWLDQARFEYEQYLAELVSICERIRR